MTERQKTRSSLLFVDAINGGTARLLPKDGAAFEFPLRLLPEGIREGEIIKLTAAAQDNKERLGKTESLLLSLENKPEV